MSPPPSLLRRLAVLVVVVLAVSACTGGSTVADGGRDSTSGTDRTSDADSTGGTDRVDGPTTTADGAAGTADDDGADDDDDDGDEPDGPTIPGLCSIDEVNVQPFYTVADIPADDPDGGLNIRDDFDNGEVVATLAEGTVVFVETCHRRDDGSIWFSAETDEVGGWANAAFLDTGISPLVPTFGGAETEAKVRSVLEALAAQDWDLAAAELQPPDSDYTTVAPLLDQPGADGDLAAGLQAYCRTRICDAPFEIIDVRGSYLPARVRPEVDVRFDYPTGSAVETFEAIRPDSALSIDSLPGRSVLALTEPPSPVADLVEQPLADDAGLYEAADEIRRALLSEDGPRIPSSHLPDDGVVISTDAYVDPVAGNRVVVDEADLATGADRLRIWGYTDGIGSPIVDSVDGYLSRYRRSMALLDPDVVGIDERVGLGNTVANLSEVFPQARVVEFHRRGRGELADFNWSSVRLALQQVDGRWELVAITSDSWTV